MKKDALVDNLQKGGPGDASEPDNINTEAWFRNLSSISQEKAEDPNSILSQARDKNIWFCSIPFTQVYTEINGNYQACCFGRDSGVKVEDVSLKEWMEESEYMNSIRKEMLDPNSKLESVDLNCKRCRDDERRYGRSRRTNCMKMHTNDHEFWDGIQRSAELYKASGHWAFDERICEIQLKVFGSQCNLDCHMCFHSNSTTRQKNAEKGAWNDAVWGEKDQDYYNLINRVMKDRTKGIVEQCVELAPYTRSIKIIGGEPLIMKKQYELLDALIECGEAKNIRIKYQTNLTKLQSGKHKFVNYIPHFKSIAMVASVDGVGDVANYLRRKSDWKEIEKNIDILQKFDNVKVDFNGLVSFLSVLRFYEVVDYVRDNDFVHQLNWAMLEWPPHLRVNNLPQKLKDELIPKYKEWPDITSALEMPAEVGINIQNIFDYLIKHDKVYEGTKFEYNLFDIFPELEEYYIDRGNLTEEQKALFEEWDKQAQQAAGGEILI